MEEEVLGIQQDTSWTSFLLVGRFLPLLVWHCLATFELRLHSLVAVAFHLPPVLQGQSFLERTASSYEIAFIYTPLISCQAWSEVTIALCVCWSSAWPTYDQLGCVQSSLKGQHSNLIGSTASMLSDIVIGMQATGQDKRRQREQQRQQQQQRQQNNFFASFFQNQRQASQQRQQPGSNRRKYDGPDEGPVIDVEYTTIDEQN